MAARERPSVAWSIKPSTIRSTWVWRGLRLECSEEGRRDKTDPGINFSEEMIREDPSSIGGCARKLRPARNAGPSCPMGACILECPMFPCDRLEKMRIL